MILAILSIISCQLYVACHRLARHWISRCTLGMLEAAQCCTAWALSMQRALSSHSTPQVCMLPTCLNHTHCLWLQSQHSPARTLAGGM